MKKILFILFITLNASMYAQDIEIEETVMESNDDSEGQIMTVSTMYTNKIHKKLVYNKTVDNLLFINAYDGSLSAYDVNNKMQWRFKPKDSIRLSNGRNKFYYKDGVIFTAYLTGHIYAINAKDGSIFWQGKIGLDTGELKLRGQLLKPHNNKLYLTSENGNIYVLNASNGDMEWLYGLDYNYNHIPNLVHNGILYIPNAPYVYNFDAETGKALYQRGFKKAMYGKPLSQGKNIIIANESRTLFSLAPDNLDINWEYALDKNDYKIGEKIVVDNNSIYFGTYSNTDSASIYKVNALDGSRTWSTKIPENRIAYVALHENTIYGYTKKGVIFSVDKNTGKTLKISTPKNKPVSNLEYKGALICYYAKAGLIHYNPISEEEKIMIPYVGTANKTAGDSQILNFNN